MSNQQVQKVKVRRLAHIGLWANDVLTQARFYHQVLGLDLRTRYNASDSDNEEDDNFFMALGEEHHCLGLFNDTRASGINARRPIQHSPLHHLTFEVDSEAEMAALAARLNLAGVDLTLGPRDGEPEGSDTLWLNDPDGNSIEISVATDMMQVASGTARATTLRPYSLQHVALYTARLEAMVEFYTEALGFDISDWLLRERAWLRCNNDHHTLLLIQGKPGIDHVGYNIADSAELLRWADNLSHQHIPLVWGPGRHGASNDLFIRFVDPEGIHIELTTEMQQYYDHDVTAPPRLWHTRASALNLWGTMPGWIQEETQA